MRIRALTAAGILCSAPVWAQVPAGPEFQVNVFTTGTQLMPAVAADADGNFVVVWRSDWQDDSFGGIFGRRYDAAGTPGPEFAVNTVTTGPQSHPRVASDPGGGFVVVWQTWEGGASGYQVQAQRYSASGAPEGVNFQVNTWTTGDQFRPDIARDASGNLVVVWQSFAQDGSLYGIHGQRFDAAGSAVGAEFQVNTFTPGRQDNPAVAVAPGGGFVVAWESALLDGSSFGIAGRRYDAAGAPLGEEFQVNTYTTGYQTYPRVAVAPGGAFMVAWNDSNQDGSYSGTFARRYDASGSAQGLEFQVSSSTIFKQEYPAIAADASGNFIVVWQDRPWPAPFGVYGRRYDAAGAPTGPEFHVDAYTTGNQAWAAVAAASSGNFVVAWTSSGGQDGMDYGIFGRRFVSDLIFADGFE